MFVEGSKPSPDMLSRLEPAQRRKMERLPSLGSKDPEPVRAMFLLLDYFPETLYAYMHNLHQKHRDQGVVPFRLVITVLSDVAEVGLSPCASCKHCRAAWLLLVPPHHPMNAPNLA